MICSCKANKPSDAPPESIVANIRKPQNAVKPCRIRIYGIFNKNVQSMDKGSTEEDTAKIIQNPL